ncbi:hypothetical protein [uncultured Georgenia sp.]|uniref:hypothetical protein n=1 Tax=uncultured Georgenia sp. TaxID=378209 RepID=UPI0026029E1E|nr:hypothetical protein [uncultured Georgenia sp.]
MFFIPYVLALLVIGYVFSYLFNFSLPAIGQALGIEALSASLLADPERAWLGIVVMTVWQGAAFTIIITSPGCRPCPASSTRPPRSTARADGASSGASPCR